eukprot:2725108-Alexandrium_andersonii.AAC.1
MHRTVAPQSKRCRKVAGTRSEGESGGEVVRALPARAALNRSGGAWWRGTPTGEAAALLAPPVARAAAPPPAGGPRRRGGVRG